MHALIDVDGVEHVDAEQPALEQRRRDVVAALEPGLGHDDARDPLAADQVLEQRGIDRQRRAVLDRGACRSRTTSRSSVGRQLVAADDEHALAAAGAPASRGDAERDGLRPEAGTKRSYVASFGLAPLATAGL